MIIVVCFDVSTGIELTRSKQSRGTNMSTFRVTVVLLWLCSVSAFMHPKTMPRQKPSQRTLQRQRAPAALSAAFEGFLVADGGIENFKQYVPLATCSLVLIDIALGRPVANGLASALYKVLQICRRL